MVYDISFEVIPPITLADFSKLKLSRPVVEVGDEQIGEAAVGWPPREIAKARGKTAKARDGDQVKIDFIGRIDEAFGGGTGEGFDLELGSGQFIQL